MTKSERISPTMLTDGLAINARLADKLPEFTQLVHDITVQQLQEGPKVEEQDPWKHIGRHVEDIFPVVMNDERVRAKLPEVIEEYDRMPTTAETRLRKNPGENSIIGAAAAGAVVVGLIAVGATWYCLHDVEAEPGTSVEVPHLAPFC